MKQYILKEPIDVVQYIPPTTCKELLEFAGLDYDDYHPEPCSEEAEIFIPSHTNGWIALEPGDFLAKVHGTLFFRLTRQELHSFFTETES